ncbi:quinone oxidoreductase, partial [archaeon]
MASSTHQVIEIPVTGDSSVLTVVVRPVPEIKADEVLVRTAYAGVNFIDTYHRSGVYPLRSKVIGMEGVGRVVAVGDKVTTLKVGDLVGWPATISSYAEYVAVPHDRAVAVPAGVEEQTACAAMLQGMTAHYLVTSVFPIKQGDVALVHAAAG